MSQVSDDIDNTTLAEGSTDPGTLFTSDGGRIFKLFVLGPWPAHEGTPAFLV